MGVENHPAFVAPREDGVEAGDGGVVEDDVAAFRAAYGGFPCCYVVPCAVDCVYQLGENRSAVGFFEEDGDA